jgi:hypothetical protein
MVSMVENWAEFKKNQLFERMRGLRHLQGGSGDDERRPRQDEGKADGQHQTEKIRVFTGFFETWLP